MECLSVRSDRHPALVLVLCTITACGAPAPIHEPSPAERAAADPTAAEAVELAGEPLTVDGHRRAKALLDSYAAAHTVVRGHIRAVWTQHRRTTSDVDAPITMVRLEVAEVLAGDDPGRSIAWWAWADAENGAAHLRPGDAVIVGLGGEVRGGAAYRLAHPRALERLVGGHILGAGLEIAPARLATSLVRLQGGVR